MSTAVKQGAETAAPEAARKPVEIDPNWVQLQAGGYCWNEFMVRMPEGSVFGDLMIAPGIWKNVQQNRRTALKKHDRLYILAFDESWGAEAIVTAATDLGVTLSKPAKVDMAPRTEALFENELHRVKWYGNGYAVERKKDNQRVTQIVATKGLAERELHGLYPRPAA